ncbi:CPBP family intramembrane glutamic endopeptidase [Nonlabens antarcticus]|uniref:CPBP family intramembrane glutamic endopeptidase n=1 Tax=Nonlabens antarcticus TaxID=392714 RepID=UPI001891CA11|nr:CPBP family intramembrane glutamic endopeptidase [Nonlabens antarcticus]
MKLRSILLNIAAIGIAIILPYTGWILFPFGYCFPVFILVWLCLKYQGDSFSNIGFRFKSFRFKPIWVGVSTAILIFCFLQYAFFPVLEQVVEFEDVGNALYERIRGNAELYIFILVMGWVVGGLYEEIVFHGFIFTRLEKMLPGKYATLAGFLITSILFSLYHLQLGMVGAINALIAGAGYHALIIYYKRNLWFGIFCHAAFDTIAATFLYLGYL